MANKKKQKIVELIAETFFIVVDENGVSEKINGKCKQKIGEIYKESSWPNNTPL